MAKATFQKPPKPLEISNFLGLNESVGNTEMKTGEFSFLENFRITKNYKLQKRPGHHNFVEFGAGNVNGMWQGTLASKNIMLMCWDGDVYEYDMDITTTTTDITDLVTEGTVTVVGSITATSTDIFWFKDSVYFINGTDYKVYDGTTYQNVDPYIPTVALNAPPLGGGTLFEESNLLTGKKTQTFVGDGTVLYQLAESGIDATVLVVTVDGVSKTEGSDFTVNRTLGQVTFAVAPVNLSIVSVTWDKVEAGNADLVKNHKFGVLFGVQNDTNVFIFGNPNERNVFRFSGVGKANYFPSNSFVGVGSTQYSITDLTPQYQTLFVFKEDSTKIVNPTINPNYADNTGLNPYNFGYEGLNNAIGNKAPNMVQLIKDNPLSFDGYSFRLWGSTKGVRNEVEPSVVSDRIKLSLQSLNLTNAVTFDYEFQKELWVNINSTVYVWNYGNDTMYKYTNIQATKFIDVGGDIYYGGNGVIEHVSEDYVADGAVLGTTIPCVAKLGFSDLDTLNLQKNMRDEWIAIEPSTRTSVDVKFATDRKNEEDAKTYTLEYITMDFDDMDFDDFSFLGGINPQPKRLRAKIKQFTYLQCIFENDTNNQTLTVLKVLLPVKSHRYSG